MTQSGKIEFEQAIKISLTGDSIPSGLPSELGGPSSACTPEHYLAASLASCFGLTVMLLCARRSLPNCAPKVEAVVHLEISPSGIPTIAQVQVVASLDSRFQDEALWSADDPLGVARLLERAERACLISTAIRPVHPVQVSVRFPGGTVAVLDASRPQSGTDQ